MGRAVKDELDESAGLCCRRATGSGKDDSSLILSVSVVFCGGFMFVDVPLPLLYLFSTVFAMVVFGFFLSQFTAAAVLVVHSCFCSLLLLFAHFRSEYVFTCSLYYFVYTFWS